METVSQTAENLEINQSEHEAAMVAKADKAEAAAVENTDEFGNMEEEAPLYAGKYKSPEDLEKAYKELESKLGKKDTEEPKTTEEAKTIVEQKGLNFDELNQEFAEKGVLSKETYSKLEKAGITKNTVDSYIAGQQALVEQQIQGLYTITEGEGNYNKMVEWARENLDESEKQGFNQMVNNEASAKFAIKGLYARYKAEAEPNLLRGTGAPASSGYQSKREMMEDMASHKYKVDPFFRKQVQDRVARSSF